MMKSWEHVALCSVGFCSSQLGTDVHMEVHECEGLKNGFTDQKTKSLGLDGCGYNSQASHVPYHHESFYTVVGIELVLGLSRETEPIERENRY